MFYSLCRGFCARKPPAALGEMTARATPLRHHALRHHAPASFCVRLPPARSLAPNFRCGSYISLARARAHTHTHTHARTHERTHARTHARTRTRTQARTYARRHARTHAAVAGAEPAPLRFRRFSGSGRTAVRFALSRLKRGGLAVTAARRDGGYRAGSAHRQGARTGRVSSPGSDTSFRHRALCGWHWRGRGGRRGGRPN